ncbi:hypothetical protein KOR42_33940 [Thalassoglobus neptunius]|uniref:Uncharacterized protein n=1 Tax=Thalassoglobus neptunius TaxID=1938619 RepID=A0A5C5WM16_9PLAN|nr:hypothetical protein [Thalassoglobus neptunius]TWT51708.1 hypothetical protein KOR42_33940 [Thalassoglobus neptunius]
MSFKYCEYSQEHVPYVQRFNKRLKDGGSTWEFYEDPTPSWLAKTGDGADHVWRELYVAVENGEEVRGAFCLKPQKFIVNGEETMLASWQGPVSEGIVDNKYNMLGFLMMRELERREPRLVAWGVSASLKELLDRLRWEAFGTPVVLDIVHPFRFLRQNAFLRTSRVKRAVCDLLAFTGAGFVGAKLAQLAWRIRGQYQRKRGFQVTTEPKFAEWADELWAEVRNNYQVIADRSAVSLNQLMPTGDWPNVTILRLAENENGKTVGWIAVRLQQLEDDKRFGNLKVGSLVDFLSLPGWEATVVEQAREHLRKQGADVIVGNLTHRDWIAACEACGFLSIADRRLLYVSPKLVKSVGSPIKEWGPETHLTLIDGDGPLGL